MTAQRRDAGFETWLRGNPWLESHWGYGASDVDLIWEHRPTGRWMVLELKTWKGRMAPSQSQILMRLNRLAEKGDRRYHGTHLLQMEHSSPTDGRMWLDGQEISERDLVDWLTFVKPGSWYRSLFRGGAITGGQPQVQERDQRQGRRTPPLGRDRA